MNLKLFTKQNLVSVAASLVLFSGVSAVFAWTTPPPNPPSGNLLAPINEGALYQMRQGKLGFFGPGTGIIMSATTDYSRNSGQVQFLSLAANGKVGAAKYCDKKGLNCYTTLELKALLKI